MPEGAEAGPDLSHRCDVERIECAEGCDVEIHLPAIAAAGAVEFLITQENGAGDDSGAELKEDNRSRVGVQAGGLVAESAVVFRQPAEEDLLLYLFNGSPAKAFDPVAHGQNANGGDVTSHDNSPDSNVVAKFTSCGILASPWR
jgi:hypothetical protein